MKCLPGVCRVTAEGRSQTWGSLLQLGAIAEDRQRNSKLNHPVLRLFGAVCV